MFTLFEPSETEIADYFAAQKDLPFSYQEIGASKDEIPSGYPINHRRLTIGRGAVDYARARKAIDRWIMYQLNWTRVYPNEVQIAVGESVCVVVNHGFCWSVNPCRIVYVLDESKEKVARYGFAFGTLSGSRRNRRREIYRRIQSG